MITSAREEGNGSSSPSDDHAREESSPHEPLHVTPAKTKALLPECDDTATTNVMRTSFNQISFRQHETVIAVPQGGMSTVPSTTLGRVTAYIDHQDKSVDEYERQRDGNRKKYNQLDCPPPRSRMVTSPRGKQRRQELKAMRIKSIKDGESTNSNPPRSPGNSKASNINMSNGRKNGTVVNKWGLIAGGRPSPLKESFGRFRSSLTEMSKQVAERWSILSSPTAADNDDKRPGDEVSNASPPEVEH